MTPATRVVAGAIELEEYRLDLVDPRGELHDVAYLDVADRAEALSAARDLLAATPDCRDGHLYTIVGGVELYVDSLAHPNLAVAAAAAGPKSAKARAAEQLPGSRVTESTNQPTRSWTAMSLTRPAAYLPVTEASAAHGLVSGDRKEDPMVEDNRLAHKTDELAQLTAAVHTARAALEHTRRRQYAQECALHDARSAKVDAWIAAAYERLHEAISDVRQATADLVAAQAAVHNFHTQVVVS
jgi:hypothetical protein